MSQVCGLLSVWQMSTENIFDRNKDGVCVRVNGNKCGWNPTISVYLPFHTSPTY